MNMIWFRIKSEKCGFWIHNYDTSLIIVLKIIRAKCCFVRKFIETERNLR